MFFPRLGTRHYAIRLGSRVTLPREARDATSLERAMRGVVAEFEDVIREFPHQWFQFAPFWPEEHPRSNRRGTQTGHGGVRARSSTFGVRQLSSAAIRARTMLPQAIAIVVRQAARRDRLEDHQLRRRRAGSTGTGPSA